MEPIKQSEKRKTLMNSYMLLNEKADDYIKLVEISSDILNKLKQLDAENEIISDKKPSAIPEYCDMPQMFENIRDRLHLYYMKIIDNLEDIKDIIG